MKTAEIRRRFIDYFAKHDHSVVPSASLLYNDPTLLFVNAGMVPFKPYFMGEEPTPYRRAVSVQKCVRTLDIDEVGKTTRHGTFFQMTGNFSFGDYFKEGAIEYAWELVTTEAHNGGFGFDPDRVWVTALHGDDETVRLWKKVGVPESRIQLRGKKDNYWHMGVPGPGGPCSEIYIDRGPEFGPDGGPEADEDRFLEIWNLVFQQEEITNVRTKEDFDVVRQLDHQNIDTGGGLERTAYLLQGVNNMYEIDEVYPVIERACELSGKRYGANPEDDVRFRVVADHVRSGLMLMGDGVTPGNEARGYVLRRLLRRSIRAMRLLGVQDPVLRELLPVSKAQMEASYPELNEAWTRIQEVSNAEEESFRRTLNAGTQLFDVAVQHTKQAKSKVLSGKEAFQLHDTYGFPIDLTLEMAAEQGLSVDRDKFNELMAEQKQRARADAKAKKGGATSTEAYRELRDQGETPFRGYHELNIGSVVRGIVTDGQVAEVAHDGDEVEIVLDETPFYAEAGGQDADRGWITTADGARLEVLDVQRPVPGLTVHKVKVSGELNLGVDVQAEVDPEWRHSACQAHTATHVIHAALRELVGPTATQAGSYNKPGYLRFDFSANHGLSPALKAEIEARANEAIRDDFEVTDIELPLEEARRQGALAMFGEKYPQIVRMVEFDGSWSRELCGGTHVAHTSQIGLLNLLGEQSIGAGVRRVECLVSTDAFNQFAAERALVTQLSETLRVRPEMLPDRVEKLVSQLKDAEKRIHELKTAQVMAGVDSILAAAKQLNGVTLIAQALHDIGGGDLRQLATQLRAKLGSSPGVVALVGGSKEKPQAVVATNEAARERGLKAGQLIGVLCGELGGRGGGKDDLAQGGGSDSANIAQALASVERMINASE